MSAAEIRINNLCKSIYSDYNFESLSSSDKRYFLVVFSNMLGADLDDEDGSVCTLPKYTVQELRDRVAESMQEIRDGKGQPIDDFLEEVEHKHPWLCK